MKISFLLILILLCQNMSAQVFHYIIAKDGSGNYHSIQSLIDRLPDNSNTTIRIFIKNGVYEEKLHLNTSKKNVSFIGESRGGVIITWNDYAGKDGMSAASTYTFLVEGDDFYAENITIENTAGSGAQAIAVRTTGERQIFKNCKFLGHQDTYYAHKKRQYNINCFIQGNTDFIYGDATAVFDSCTINCVAGGQYITAPADTKLTSTLPGGDTLLHGLLFRNCSVTKAADVGDNTFYLGRPWQPNASSVYINCTLDDHIRPQGWSTWEGSNHLSSYFAEYRSINTAGMPVDTTNRVDWSYQLSSELVDNYYTLEYFLKKEDVIWDPVPSTIALPAPKDLTGESFILTWTSDPDAIGYTIIRNDSAIGFSESSIFTDETADIAVENVYRIRSVSEKGNLSETSEEFNHHPLANNEIKAQVADFKLIIDDKIITLNDSYAIRIYSLSGQLLLNRRSVRQLSLIHLSAGTYILVAEDELGLTYCRKVIIN